MPTVLSEAGFQFTEHEIERQIAEATRRGTEELRTEPLATAVRYDSKARRVVVELNKGTTLTVPVDLMQGLQAASPRDLARVEIVGPGVAIEWPNLDQQFSIMGLLAGVFGTRAWTAKLASLRAPEIAKTKATTPASRKKRRETTESKTRGINGGPVAGWPAGLSTRSPGRRERDTASFKLARMLTGRQPSHRSAHVVESCAGLQHRDNIQWNVHSVLSRGTPIRSGLPDWSAACDCERNGSRIRLGRSERNT